MTISEFWQAQQFSYVATYSFNRGPKLLAQQGATREAIVRTKHELQTARYMQISRLLSQLRRLEHEVEMGAYHVRLTEGNFTLTTTAEQLVVASRDSGGARQLGEIMAAPGPQGIAAACSPIYRDALAFYDEGQQLVSVLNICFSCCQMVTHANQWVEADLPTYEALRIYFIQLGHLIADDEPY